MPPCGICDTICICERPPPLTTLLFSHQPASAIWGGLLDPDPPLDIPPLPPPDRTWNQLVEMLLAAQVLDGVLELSLHDELPPSPVDSTFWSTCKTVELATPTECVVCLELMLENAVQLPCTHVFHKDCVTPWFDAHNTCPVCRHQF